MLDIKILILISFFILSISTTMSFFLIRRYKDKIFLKYFLAFNICFLIGQILVILRNSIPDFYSIVVGNILLITGQIFLYLAVKGLFKFEVKWKSRYLIPIFIAFCGFVLFTYIYYDTYMRIVVFSVLTAIYSIVLGKLFLTAPYLKLNILNLFTGFIFFLAFLLFTFRVINVFNVEFPVNYLKSTALMVTIPYVYMNFICVWLSLVFTLNLKINHYKNENTLT